MFGESPRKTPVGIHYTIARRQAHGIETEPQRRYALVVSGIEYEQRIVASA